MNNMTKDEIRSSLTSVLQSHNLTQELITELLSDTFVSGAYELVQNEPENNEFMIFLRNFSDEQNLSSIENAKQKINAELAKDGYFCDVFQYVIDAWRDIDFSYNTQRNRMLMGDNNTSQDAEITPKDIDKASTISGIVMDLLKIPTPAAVVVDEAFLWGKVAVAVHNQYKKFYDIVERMTTELERFLKGTFTAGKEATSPLVIDLDGDGVETVSEGNGVHFDHDGNGFAEKTGWAGKDDGILVRDINGNGEIEDGTELFGNNSVLASGQKAANGFEALKDLDSNKDGIFNSSDTAWNSVKVWKDANQNGFVEDGEILTLEQAGVTGINLGYTNSDTVDANGNTHGQNSTATKTDGTTTNISDIWFDTDLTNTVDRSDVTIPDAIKALPNVTGFGNVHDLQTAMAF